MTMDTTKQIRQNRQKHFNPNNLNHRYTQKIKLPKEFSQQCNGRTILGSPKNLAILSHYKDALFYFLYLFIKTIIFFFKYAQPLK